MQKSEFYMHRCLELAYKGIGKVSPNPMVGSLIVHDDKIIGEGYHEEYGLKHAEVNAINNVENKSLLSSSTLYVNLEPCSHFGNTPPCSKLIIKHKIPKVVIGCIDTSSKVSGKGIREMRKSGIEVTIGVLEKESRSLNKRFFTFHEQKRPYIILKWAKSKDGFIAPDNQTVPFWMTSSKSKEIVHKWRSEEDSILVGRITAKKDNPSLTVREVEGRNPVRIVIDKNLSLPCELNLFNSEAKTIIFNNRESQLKSSNHFVKIDFNNVPQELLGNLYKKNMQSIIIEGGNKTLESFINANLWDEARVFTSNKELGCGLYAPMIKGGISYNSEIDTDFLKIIIND